MTGVIRDGALECADEQRELPLASDHRRVEPTCESRRMWVDLHDSVGPQRLSLPFQHQRFEWFGDDRVADEPIRRFADQDLARTRGLLETRRHVDWIACREHLLCHLPGDDNLARIQSGAHLDLEPVRAAELGIEDAERIPHVGSRAHGAEGVVFANMLDPEDRHDRVADELLDRSPVRLDHRSHGIEVARKQGLESLRVEALTELGGPDDVAEHDRDRAARLGPGITVEWGTAAGQNEKSPADSLPHRSQVFTRETYPTRGSRFAGHCTRSFWVGKAAALVDAPILA